MKEWTGNLAKRIKEYDPKLKILFDRGVGLWGVFRARESRIGKKLRLIRVSTYRDIPIYRAIPWYERLYYCRGFNGGYREPCDLDLRIIRQFDMSKRENREREDRMEAEREAAEARNAENAKAEIAGDIARSCLQHETSFKVDMGARSER